MKDAIIAELVQHATEELSHPTLVSDRIIQLGGTLKFNFKNFFYRISDRISDYLKILLRKRFF